MDPWRWLCCCISLLWAQEWSLRSCHVLLLGGSPAMSLSMVSPKILFMRIVYWWIDEFTFLYGFFRYPLMKNLKRKYQLNNNVLENCLGWLKRMNQQKWSLMALQWSCQCWIDSEYQNVCVPTAERPYCCCCSTLFLSETAVNERKTHIRILLLVGEAGWRWQTCVINFGRSHIHSILIASTAFSFLLSLMN